jgi:hypothetical protein
LSQEQERANHLVSIFRTHYNLHENGCNLRRDHPAPSDPVTGETFDVYVIQHCDCFMSLQAPSHEETMAFLRRINPFYSGLHDKECAQMNPIHEKYRNEWVWVRLNCTCWLAPAPKG